MKSMQPYHGPSQVLLIETVESGVILFENVSDISLNQRAAISGRSRSDYTPPPKIVPEGMDPQLFHCST